MRIGDGHTTQRLSRSEVSVDRSTTRWNSVQLNGQTVDGGVSQRTGQNQMDQSHYLAKVMVVGSNPVFRS